ncbi:hypothetical protein OCU04_012009 [Sclerotinia nivalis]|uniref:Uncharacterized protein n=1 Tax=Sclerotinia nivalis TaxID=352851 RepID=A0A9X0DDQ7_9HELO|nr:hypothetical protein OCU04_012009 [Sclerotinia nivalis]
MGCGRSESLFHLVVYAPSPAYDRTVLLLLNDTRAQSINGYFEVPLKLFGGCHDHEEVLPKNMKHFGSCSLLAGANRRRISKFRSTYGFSIFGDWVLRTVHYWE